MSEMTWALEWCGLSNWLARNRLKPLLDVATGTEATGTVLGVTTGPDGYSTSALSISSVTISGISISGDVSISMWLRGVTTPLTLFTIGSFVVTIQAGNIIVITDGVNTGNINLSRDYVSWTQLVITREGNIIRVYENGVLTNTVAFGSIETISGSLIIGACILSDLRIKTNANSAESILYMYNDMINNNGNSTCPII